MEIQDNIMGDLGLDFRERFISTLQFKHADRIPFYDQDIREKILEQWYRQGLSKGCNIKELFKLEKWEIVPVNLDMIPEFQGRFKSRKDFKRLQGSFQLDNKLRYPGNWESLVKEWNNRNYPLGITVWNGFFTPLNSGSASYTVFNSFTDIVRMIYSNPELLEEMAIFIAEFVIKTISKALN
jgi:hypothetical protein